MPAHRPSSQRLMPLLATLALFPGIGITYLGVIEIARDARLDRDARPIEAEVVDRRMRHSRRAGDTYEVRYRFVLEGKTYSARDAMGRTDLWIPIVPQVWERSGHTGVIDVVYAPSDPWTNRPHFREGFPMGDHVAAICMGWVCLAPSLLVIAGAIRRAIRGSTAARSAS